MCYILSTLKISSKFVHNFWMYRIHKHIDSIILSIFKDDNVIVLQL